mgnify:CR=1 FL=1
MNVCKRLSDRSFEEKLRFLRPRGICFGCLKGGHLKRDCNEKLNCNICQELHPTVFHNHKGKESEQKDNGKEINQGNEVCEFIGAGNFERTMSIVPVKVKIKGERQCVSTYAFLDNESSATFCTEGLMRRLHVKGRKSKISLRTMGDDRVVDTYIVRGIQICGLDNELLNCQTCSPKGKFLSRKKTSFVRMISKVGRI